MKSLLTKKNHGKTIILASAAIITTLLGVSYYVYGMNGTILGWPSENTIVDSVNLTPATSDQVKTGQEIKKSKIEENNGDVPSDESQDAFTVTISASTRSENSYQLRTLINTLISNGSCDLVLKKGDVTITKVAKTQPLANDSTCQGFDIPLSELESGEWTYTLTVINNDNNASSNTTGILTI